MNYGKLSTKDWKSPALRLININNRPKSRDRVSAECSKCNTKKEFKYIELIRAVNRHLKYADAFLCKECLCNLPLFKQIAHDKSKLAIDKITKGASERSKALWKDDAYKQKMANHYTQLSKSESFKCKVSESIKEKFKDPEYLDKIKKARRNYWRNRDYKSIKVWSIDDFLCAAGREHGERYNYELVRYENIRTKVDIVCKSHGIFSQRPSHHIFYGNGCPKCSWEIKESRPQKEIISWLENEGYVVESNNRNEIELELDVYLPNEKLAIEYHGGYWHSFDRPESTRQRKKHSRKASMALDKGIRLVQVFDVEWLSKSEIIKSIILNKLGRSKRLFARNCKIVEISKAESNEFFKLNHLAGSRGAHLHYGLFYDRELISSLSLYDKKNGVFELMRFAHLINHTVVGGLSRMLKHAINNYNIKEITTYADRRYSDANGYKKVGFVLETITQPGYYYWRNNKLYNRRKFQKHKLHKLLASFDPTQTESENMFGNGYRRIWDAGHYRLSMKV